MSISKNSQNIALDTKRHSFAHLMAAAVKQMFPESQFGVGPVLENGCYYDFILPRTLIPEDLPLIEAKIDGLLKRKLEFKVQEMSLSDAILLFERLNQPLKVELLNDLATRGTTSMSEEERDALQTSYEILPAKTGEVLDAILYVKQPDGSLKYACVRYQDTVLKDYPEHYFASGIGFEDGQDEEKVVAESIKDRFGVIVQKLEKLASQHTKDFDNVLHYYFAEVDSLDLEVTAPVKNFKIFEIDEVNSEVIFPMTAEIIQDFDAREKGVVVPKITVYRLEDDETGEDLFVDLCKGPHVVGRAGFDTLRSVGFKLDKFSGSYWRGDQERNIQMQRIYALVYENKEELEKYMEQRKLAQERDHRKLGKELEIFTVSDEVGSGLPLYLPKGAVIRQLLEKYCFQEAKKSGYQYVYTPHIGKSDLFQRSGHLDHYADGMFAPIDMVNLKGEGVLAGGTTEKFYLKPMNCPMHHMIYLNKPRSYRDLPFRLYEYGTVYRYEESGTLSGLIRVRGFTQNDAHVYCQRDQLKEVIGEALNRFTKAYKDIGITDYKIRFSLPDFVNDKEKYGEETQEWKDAVNAMRQALDDLKVDYYDAIGEAAFYGPKIDIQVKNVNGKEDSLSTIQVDYSIAPKFDITFKNDQGEEEVPAIIHMALMGSVDRFMAFMLEMTGGRLPFWLAPEQIRILTINDQVLDYVEKVKEVLNDTLLMKPLKYNEIRYEVDSRAESLGKKIREAETQKVPVILIVGPRDVEAGQVSVRTQEGESKVKLEELKVLLEGMK